MVEDTNTLENSSAPSRALTVVSVSPPTQSPTHAHRARHAKSLRQSSADSLPSAQHTTVSGPLPPPPSPPPSDPLRIPRCPGAYLEAPLLGSGLGPNYFQVLPLSCYRVPCCERETLVVPVPGCPFQPDEPGLGSPRVRFPSSRTRAENPKDRLETHRIPFPGRRHSPLGLRGVGRV